MDVPRLQGLQRRALPLLASSVEAGRLLAGGRMRTAGGLVLTYHDVGDDHSERTFYSVTPAELRRQLEDARGWGVQFVELGELTARQLRGEPVDGLAAVVFDDSLLGVHRYAAALLAELGIPATVFAVSAGLGGAPSWWPGSARIMNRAELGELLAAGITIESHSRTHQSLPALDDCKLADELHGSRADIEELTGRPVRLFSYPYGHFDQRVRDAVEEAGYEAAFTFVGGRLVEGVDPFRLPRVPMGRWHTKLKLAFDLARTPASWNDPQPTAHHG